MLISGKVSLNPYGFIIFTTHTLILMKKIYLLLAMIALAGCGSTSSDKIPETFGPESETGLAIGTITFEAEKPVNDIYRFFYEGTSDDAKFNKRNGNKIMIKARNEENEKAFSGDFANGHTYLFVIEAQPGTYAFTQYNYLDRIGPTGMVSSSKTFAIPYEVKKGEITYVGELSYNDLSEPGSPRLVVYDRYARDLEELAKKHPKIDWRKAVNKTAKAGNTGGGIVDFR
jgi:hypothetical protein